MGLGGTTMPGILRDSWGGRSLVCGGCGIRKGSEGLTALCAALDAAREADGVGTVPRLRRSGGGWAWSPSPAGLGWVWRAGPPGLAEGQCRSSGGEVEGGTAKAACGEEVLKRAGGLHPTLRSATPASKDRSPGAPVAAKDGAPERWGWATTTTEILPIAARGQNDGFLS